VAHATRLSFLIDADAYFRAFARAVQLARSTIDILAWDIDSRVPLDAGGGSQQLGPFLDQVVRGSPELEVHLLSWAPSALYALERELALRMTLGWGTHERLHLRLDDTHAPTAGHHQKVVVIDDALAFVGGIDLTSHRWDTPEHRPQEPRRVTTRGRPYGPFHDVQAGVSGDICRALGDVHRRRWRHHTGVALKAPRGPRPDLWVEGLAADAFDLDVGLITTDPEIGARFTEAFHLAAIAAARERIYV
jgi:phosphatidylserine/phosphatidylglycerophosphate/cardiolipin synthase-like enzyme